MKTWPAITAEMIQVESDQLRQRAISITSNKKHSQKTVGMLIAGILCPITLDRSARMLIRHLDKEQEELVALCNKYNRLSLDREAIIKTRLFRKIVRRVDIANDLFFFESFSGHSSSEVFGDVQALENSIVTSKMNRLAEEIGGYQVPSDLNVCSLERRVRSIINDAKNLLWRRRSDMGLVYQKRIPIQFLDPPDRTKDRIVQWKEQSFTPKIIAHRDSFTVTLPEFCVRLLKDCFERKYKQWGRDFYQETLDKYNSPSTHRPKEFDLDQVWFDMMKLLKTIQPDPSHRDPIVYSEEGDWTVVIDQYAEFPKEKEIMCAVKEHYKILGEDYAVFAHNN